MYRIKSSILSRYSVYDFIVVTVVQVSDVAHWSICTTVSYSTVMVRQSQHSGSSFLKIVQTDEPRFEL